MRPPPAKDLVAEGAKQVQGPRLREHPLRGHQARPLQDLEPLPRDVKVWRQGLRDRLPGVEEPKIKLL